MTFAGTASRVLAYRPGRFIRGSAFLFVSLAMRAAGLAALFVLLARELGPKGYGSFVAVQALAGLLAPLAGFGAQALMVREAARHPEALAALFGDVWRVWTITAPLLAIAALTAAITFLPGAMPVHAVAAIVVSEVLCATLVETVSRVHQSQDRMGRMGAVMTGLALTRLLTFVALSPLLTWTAVRWAWGYLFASLLYALALMVTTTRELGQPDHTSASFSMIIRGGFPFAFSGCAQRVQAEVNKPLLARLDSIVAVGSYTAAHRTVDILLLPLAAMLEVLSLRVYRAERPAQVLLQLGSAPLMAAIAGGIFLFTAAPLLPVILGESYAASAPVARMLAGLPFLIVVRLLLTMLIVAEGNTRQLIPIYGLGALTSIGLNVALIPYWGLMGAVCAAYSAEFMLITSQGVLLAAYRYAR